MVFDVDGPKAIETRRKFYDMAVAEKSLIAGFQMVTHGLRLARA